MRLSDRVVLVTGGTRGVGAGITRVFRDAGATVVTCARRPPDREDPGFVACDVREPDQVSALIGTVVDRHGRLDVLVNNAGGSPQVNASEASPRFHAKVVELNLLAPLLVSQAANRVMQDQSDGGVIVMVSSVSGRRPSPGTAGYGAAKAGLDSLTGSLAVEWAPKVRVNALAVGPVRTELSDMHYPELAAVAKTVPLGRLAEPEDVGNCALFLASPLASYVSGATLLVHGGGEWPAFLAAQSSSAQGER
ncbi:SDR family oxidoreductase [Kutzneria kofuensis]|uniref:NAD(P)-dependent dehydrogenase (Short-subunit alcohol dehydrogenase family) n=1 Tax=Kutzneria kofuensis TaxID=103725 RepID=A0A7W9NE66_9PSEU|nr:NAD(P)-dependent dehydrogenase (short-subunit alcohol dehydrogenase family) [Kutzneria kofuensis]